MDKLRTFFDPRHKTKVHILQLVIMTSAIVLTIARMAMPVITTRANMMALTMVRAKPHTAVSELLLTLGNKTGHQILHHHRLPAPHRAQGALQEVGLAQGQRDPQHTGDCVLVRRVRAVVLGEHDVLHGGELCAELDCDVALRGVDVSFRQDFLSSVVLFDWILLTRMGDAVFSLSRRQSSRSRSSDTLRTMGLRTRRIIQRFRQGRRKKNGRSVPYHMDTGTNG